MPRNILVSTEVGNDPINMMKYKNRKLFLLRIRKY